MSDYLFNVLSDERFMDLSMYQYGYEKCKPLHSYGPFIRNHYLFHFVLSGKGTLFVSNRNSTDAAEYTIETGSGFIILPNQITTYCADQETPWEYCWIEFDGLLAKEFLESAGLTDSSPVFHPRSSEASDRISSEMLYICHNATASSLHLTGHLYLFLDALVQGSIRKREVQGGRISRLYTKEAVGFIEKNYAYPITVEDMAARCNLDRSYFGKIFREAMGLSPQAFLIRYRMTKAAELLITSSMSIGEISIQVGYPNQLHFSRAFRNVYKVSPREYRQKNKLL